MTDVIPPPFGAKPWGHAADARSQAPVSENDPIACERAEALPDAAFVKIYRDYAKGRQPLDLTEQQCRMLDGLLGHAFADNVYGQILRINGDRLKVTGFDIAPPRGLSETEAAAQAEAVDAYLTELCIKARFDIEQNKINKAVLRDGNHAVGLAWDEDTQRVLLFQKPWWDGSTGMYVAYGDNGLPAYAVNEWIATETEAEYAGKFGVVRRFLEGIRGQAVAAAPRAKTYRYRTMYFADRTEKYRCAENGKWEELISPREPWPLPHTKRDGSPLGIPVVHFAIGGDGYYGEPVGPMPVVANQDFLNDVRYDLAAVGRQTGFQRVILSGFPAVQSTGNPEKPDETMPIAYETGPGMMYVTENPGGDGTVLPPGDPNGLIAIYNTTLESMSRQTQTPFFLLTVGANTSGAAILRAETPLASKAQEQAESLGPSYAMLMHRAIELYNAKNRAGITLSEDALITPVWADTSKPDAMAVLEYEKAKNENERAAMVLELERKALSENRPIYLPAGDIAERLAVVTAPQGDVPAADNGGGQP